MRSDSHAPSDRFPCPQAVQFGLLCGAVRRAGDPPGNSALRLSYQPGQCAGRHELAVGGDARRGRITGAATDRSCGRAGWLRGGGRTAAVHVGAGFYAPYPGASVGTGDPPFRAGQEQVRRVAVCTGAGASLLGEARRAQADVYVTSDLKYNDFMTPDGAFVVADIGHFESEYCAIDILFDILSKIYLPLRFARV